MAASLLVTCRNCKHEYRVPEHAQGKRITCPHCRHHIDVPRVAKPTGQTQTDPLVGQEIAGCRLQRRLGAGAMGAVYEAEQLSLQRKVAVKLLSARTARDEDLVKRFSREARIAATIQHHNIVQVIDHGHARGAHYLVMEYVEGDTLAGIIRDQPQGRLAWRSAAELIIQVARALDRLAREGIAHRDIKPANILVSADGVAKIADLGLAKQTDPSAAMSLVTMPGSVMGTPAYMAPEQAKDSSQVTPATDVYGLGATFYHAVTGQPPFSGRNAMDVFRSIGRVPITPPNRLAPDLPDGINDLIMEFLEFDPEERPQNPAEAIDAMITALEAPAHRRSRRRLRRRRRR